MVSKVLVFSSIHLVLALFIPFTEGVVPAANSSTCHGHLPHAHCMFVQSLCMSTDVSGGWLTSSSILRNSSGVALSVVKMGSNIWGNWSGCDDYFAPVEAPRDVEQPGQHMKLPGNYVFVCTWIHHFGHVLMDHLLPAFLALHSFYSSSDNVTIIVDAKIKTAVSTPHVTYNLLSLLAPVVWLSDLKDQALAANASKLCPERMVVGFARHGLVGEDTTHGAYALMRDHVYTRYNITAPPTGCVALIVQRGHKSRFITNIDDVSAAMQDFFGSACQVVTTRLEGDILTQVRLVATLRFLITVSGSGSHHMIWLPDGSVSIVVQHPFHGDVNRVICAKHAGVLCLTANSTLAPGEEAGPASSPLARISADVIVDVQYLRQLLQIGYDWQKKQ
jgi:hypothetical protein